VAADEALLASRGLGEPPEHRTVVDVEHGRDAVAASALERERADLVHCSVERCVPVTRNARLDAMNSSSTSSSRTAMSAQFWR